MLSLRRTFVIDVIHSLLDIGPNGEGEIIEPMVKNLLDAGRWLKYAGDCVYGTVSQKALTRRSKFVLPCYGGSYTNSYTDVILWTGLLVPRLAAYHRRYFLSFSYNF
jgi:hypothetical protein